MIFIYCNRFSTRSQWSVNMYSTNRKETAIYKRRNNKQNNAKAQNKRNIQNNNTDIKRIFKKNISRVIRK